MTIGKQPYAGARSPRLYFQPVLYLACGAERITPDEDVLTRSLSNLDGMMYIGTHWRLLSLNAKKYSIH